MSESPPAAVHRALADAHRVRIVDELDRQPAGLGVDELARLLALHPNTVRWHLGVLTEAGLVSSRPEARGTTGRPRILYMLRTDADAGVRENYRLLATILVSSLAELADAPLRAVEAGRAWGKYLVRRPRPGTRLGELDAIGEVVALLAHEGFRPEPRGREIRMHQCPFRELTEGGPGIVCAVHRGLIDGALAELGSALEVERLDALVEPQLCVAHLAPLPTETASSAAASPGS